MLSLQFSSKLPNLQRNIPYTETETVKTYILAKPGANILPRRREGTEYREVKLYSPCPRVFLVNCISSLRPLSPFEVWKVLLNNNGNFIDSLFFELAGPFTA